MDSAHLQCDCCGSLLTAGGDVNGFGSAHCPSCRAVRFYTKDSAATASNYEVDAGYIEELSIYHESSELMQWHHHVALKLMENSLSLGARHLDIGCFNGFFVNEALKHGFDSYGVDFNRLAVESGQSRFNLQSRICASDATSFCLGTVDKFDVITLFEVLEHLQYPSRVLRSASHLLRAGGVIVASCPNSKMLWHPPADFPPHHVWRFTPEAMKLLFHSCGFLILRHEQQASTYELVRNFAGALLSKPVGSDMRGASRGKTAAAMKKFATSTRAVANTLLAPLDLALKPFGFRYRGQLVYAQRYA